MSEVIYSSPTATVILGDAREYLPTLPTESLSLVVTDPPYGVEWRSNVRAERFDQLVGDGADDREGIRAVMTGAWGPAHERLTFAVSKHQAGKDCVPVRMRKGTVLRYGRPTGRKVRHPSEKPVPLLRELIESSSRQGETVLDPFAGIGSTGVAAILAGRRALLVEIDPRWAQVAADRVRRAEEIAALGVTA